MNFFEKIIYGIDRIIMQKPGMYGWFHLLCFSLIILIAAITSILFHRYPSQKRLRLFTFVCWIIILLLEIGKQLVFSFSYDETTKVVTWDYQWHAFPYQFCSSPLYLLPLVAFLPDCTVRKGIIAFLATFSMFAGSAVLFYPSTVFVESTLINIQTMVHHGAQIIIGVLYLSFFKEKLNLKTFALGIAVFAIMATVALILNVSIHKITDEDFNMFFISPYFQSTLPVLSSVWSKIPYPLFLVLYLVGFSAAAFVIHLAAKGIERTVNWIKGKLYKA